MRKSGLSLFFTLTIGFFCSLHTVAAQDQYGVAIMPVFEHYVPSESTFGAKAPMVFGIRGEVLKTKLGIERFRFAYLGLAVTYFPYSKTEVTADAYGRDSLPLKSFTGTLVQSQIDGILKVGFEIRQHWSPFLFLNVGYSVGAFKAKRTYNLVDFDSQRYAIAGYETGEPVQKGFGYLAGPFLSVFYEKEKFYIFSQLDLMVDYGAFARNNLDLRINAGIYYPLNKSE